MVELVVKLDDETYKEVMDRTEFDTLSLGIKVIEVVQNGTVLPKEHGRLIDADALINKCAYDLDNNFVIDLIDIKEAQIIIEADKGGSNA